MSVRRFTEATDGLPTHGPTGTKIVEWAVDLKRDVDVHHRMPPGPPSRRVVTEWDDDGPVAYRTLADEEFSAAEETYKHATLEWNRTCGTWHTHGQITKTLKVVCADGAMARAMADGDEWRWVEWTETSQNGADLGR